MKHLGFSVLFVSFFAPACGDDVPRFFIADITSDAPADSASDTSEDLALDGSDTSAPDVDSEVGSDTPDVEPDQASDAEEDAPDTPERDAEADVSVDAGCPDADGDGVCDDVDRCPDGDDTVDRDTDGVPDACDNCPDAANPGQENNDGTMEAVASRIDYNWRSRPGFVQPLGDDEVAVVPLGFEWDFFGLTVDRIALSANGFLSVDLDTEGGCCVGGVLGASGPVPGDADPAPPGIIAGFWEDLNPLDSGQVFHGTVGAPGSREFIAAYEDIAHCCGDTPTVSFQIILRESGGAEVQCRECVPHDRGLNIATQGVESWRDETFAALRGRNSSEWSAIDDGAEFTWSGEVGDGAGDVCDPCPFDAPDDANGNGICDSDE